MTETTDITTLPPADRALIVLSSIKTEEHLLGLVSEATAITDVIDPDGREQAHRLGMKLRSARTTIEKTGKSARDDANAFAKAVIDEQKRLIAITEGEEKRVIGLRDAYDAKIEAEKEAKRQAEAKRVAEIRAKIDGIRNLPFALAGASSDEIAAELAAIDQFEPSPEVFGELIEDCVSACQECIASLKDLHARVMGQEAAAALLESERQRLEQVRIEAEQAMAAERAALQAERAAMLAEIEAMRAEKLAMEAERAALSAAQTGADSEPVVEEVMPDIVVTAEKAAEVFTEATTIVEWRIRQAAIHTAAQFAALAGKVEQCGFGAFAVELRSVATSLRDGAHDAALAKADREALIAADTLLLDATVECIDVLGEQQEAA